MKNDNDFKIFVFISLKKLIITVLNSNNQTIYKKEILLTKPSNQLNFDIINKFLDENIFIIEKTLNKFVNNIFLILDYDNFFSVNLSLKNKTVLSELNNKDINSLLIEAKNECKKTLDGNKIIHAKIDKFIVNNIEYFSLPQKINCNNLSIDINFICLPIDFIKNLEKVFNKYQISISKIISYDYLRNFFDHNDGQLFDIAAKILEGYNENEVILMNKSIKKKGLFERFFNYFN